MSKKFGFIIGTGRCGTRSVAVLVNRQKKCRSQHESLRCRWVYNEADLDMNLERLFHHHSRGSKLAVAAGSYFLPYIETLLQRYPQTKVLCLQRDKKATVRSFVAKLRGRNMWLKDVIYLPERPGSWRCITVPKSSRSLLQKKGRNDFTEGLAFMYPKFDEEDIAKAASKYYDLYYEIANSLQKKNPDNFKIYWLEDIFTNEKIQEEALFFIGVEEPQIDLNIHKNKKVLKKRGV